MQSNKDDRNLEFESSVESTEIFDDTKRENENRKSLKSTKLNCPKVNEKPDKRLSIWEKYVIEQKRLSREISGKIHRKQNQLLMNTVDYFRPRREDETLFDYTSILDPPDSERGSPSFWQVPIQIPKHPCLEAQPTAHQKCQIPVREFVTVPDVIKKEKGTIGRSDKMIEQWYNMPYRKKRRNDLVDRIKYIEPHKPELNKLVIKGEKIKKKKPVEIIIPKIIITSPEDECNYIKQKDSDLEKIVLKIRDMVIDKSECYTFLKPQIRVTFSCIIADAQNMLSSIIPITNQGTVAITCCWKQITCTDAIDNFIFSKNDFTILPGQTIMFPFLFHSKNIGIFKEYWQLCTVPQIVDENTKIIFYLLAVVGAARPNLIKIKQPKNQNISPVMRDQIIQMKQNEVPFIEGYVTKEHRFYVANFDKLTNRPKYFYQKSIVDSLEILYNTYSCLQPWDLRVESVVELVENLRSVYNRTKSLEQLNFLVNAIKYVPTDEINPEFRKYSMVYKILIVTIDLIVDEAIKIADFFELSLSPFVYPQFDENENISYQYKHLYKDNCQRLYYVRNVNESLTKCLRRSDYRIKYCEYGKSRSLQRLESRIQGIHDLNAVERFNKYKEMKVNIFQKNIETNSTDDVIFKRRIFEAKEKDKNLEQRKFGVIYIDKQIFERFREVFSIKVYFHLLNAIDDITAVTDSYKNGVRQPSLNVIERILDCQNSNRN